MTPGEVLLVGVAGLAGGAVNAVAGGGTLLTFPALLAVGVAPVTAAVTSSVGLLPGYAGGSLAYRRELAGQGSRVRSLAVPAGLGAVLGAGLLLTTPQGAFRGVVPWLVLGSCALLAVQPRLTRALARGDRPGRTRPRPPTDGAVRRPVLLAAGTGLAAVYGSYFGAGLGVLLLAVLGVLVLDDLQRLNALKGVLSLGVNAVGVAVFLGSGEVAWGPAAVLAGTSAGGGALGVALARRLPGDAVRRAVVVVGVAVGLVLLLR